MKGTPWVNQHIYGQEDSDRFRGQIAPNLTRSVSAALHKVAQEARQNAWGLYRSPRLPAVASQFTFPATGRCPAHTSLVSGRSIENLRIAKRRELPYTPLEWLTSAAPRNCAFPLLPSPPDLTGTDLKATAQVGGWQQWEVCRFPRQHPSCRSHSSYCKAL